MEKPSFLCNSQQNRIDPTKLKRQPPVVIPNQDGFVSPTKLFYATIRRTGRYYYNYFLLHFFCFIGFKSRQKGKGKFYLRRFIFQPQP
jgi:hypothetical protein